MERRKKLDCFPLMDAKTCPFLKNGGDMIWQEQDANTRTSMAWDTAFFTSPGVLDPEELFETLNFHDMAEKTRPIGNSSARASLAWDSAFFTNPGVLDTEELSLVNKGFRKHDSHHLPRIKEVWTSTRSNSRTDNNGLGSFEIDLFGGKSTTSSSVITRRTAGSELSSSSSRVKVKANQSLTMQKTRGLDQVSKDSRLPPKRQIKHATHTGESKCLTANKPPKPTTPSSRTYTIASRFRSPAKPEECSRIVSMKPCFEDSYAATASSFPKSPSMISPSAVFSSGSSGNSQRRKVSSRSSLSSSNSITPIRSSARSRSNLVSSSLPSHVLSTPKPSYAGRSPGSSSKRKSVDYAARLEKTPCGLRSSKLFDYACDETYIELGSQEKRSSQSSSCLRKPSPKIGFFDQEKNGIVQPIGYSKYKSTGSRSSSSSSNSKGRCCSRTTSFIGETKLSSSSIQSSLENISLSSTEGSRKRNKIGREKNEKIGTENYSDKENIDPLENQVEALTRNIRSIDLSSSSKKGNLLKKRTTCSVPPQPKQRVDPLLSSSFS